MSDFSFLYVPIDTAQNAESLAKKLIEEGLAICVNIVPKVTSMYRWEGKIEQSSENIMLIKIDTKELSNTRKLIESLHPYQIPCIAEISIDSLNQTYLNWAKIIR